jgi:ubiquinone/menaquinone biosynthesis C-methylase UbiE
MRRCGPQAREAAVAGAVDNIEFRTGNAYSIEVPGGTFDIVQFSLSAETGYDAL